MQHTVLEQDFYRLIVLITHQGSRYWASQHPWCPKITWECWILACLGSTGCQKMNRLASLDAKKLLPRRPG